MKVVKYIISVMALLLCFTLSSELYQFYLQTFSHQFFFFEIASENRREVYDTIIAATERYNENVFAFERRNVDAFHSEIVIFANEEMKNQLVTRQNVCEGNARSFFSGDTNVIYRPFEAMISEGSGIRYYFTGSKEAVGSIRQYIYSRMATSYIHKEPAVGSGYLIYALWILLAGFMLLMTWWNIQFSRKSDFLKLSMGSSASAIVVKNIFTDILVNFASALALYLILKNKIFIEYQLNYVFFVFCLFNLVNSCLYLSLFRASYKEIIYGAHINGKLLANTYLLKAITLILLVISLACNFTLIAENASGLKTYKTIDRLTDYATVSVTPTPEIKSDMESTEKLKSEMFLEGYLQHKVFFSTSRAELDEGPVIVINETALPYVVSDSAQFTSASDRPFVVYIPQSQAGRFDDEDIAFSALSAALDFFGLEEYSFEVRNYAHAKVTYFDLRAEVGLPFGFETLSDPVIVVCRVSDDMIRKQMEQPESIEFGDSWANIFFSTDMPAFSEETNENIADMSYNGVVGQCNRFKASRLRTVLINSVISLFLLILSIMLISVIVQMEYMISSKTIALKKILGYSLFRRNSGIIMLNGISVGIAFITGLILSAMFHIFTVLTLCMVCLGAIVIDTVLILFRMTVAENKNTAHILKGGSL